MVHRHHHASEPNRGTTRRTRLACLPFVLLSLAACTRTTSQDAASTSATPTTKDPAVTSDAASPSDDATPWSPVVDGLQIRAIPPSTPATPGSTIAVTLELRNTSKELRRIYLLQSEPFRAMQSTFFLALPEPSELSMQPEPRPHGIVVTETDFHELPPGEIKRFTQSLRLPVDLPAGTLAVRWQYENHVTEWKGGVQTLDGPTKALFGGGPIPGIWVGEIEAPLQLAVVAQ